MSDVINRRRTRSNYESEAGAMQDSDGQAPPPAKRQKISANNNDHTDDSGTPKGLDPNRGRARGRYQRSIYKSRSRSRSESSERSWSRNSSRSRSHSSSRNQSCSPSPRPSGNRVVAEQAATPIAPTSTATRSPSPLSHADSKSGTRAETTSVTPTDPVPVTTQAPDPSPADQILLNFNGSPPIVMFTSYRTTSSDPPSTVCTILADDMSTITGCYTSQRYGPRVTDILLSRVHQKYTGFPFFKSSRHLLAYIKSELALLPQQPIGMIQLVFSVGGMLTIDVEYRAVDDIGDSNYETKHVRTFSTFARFVERIESTQTATDDMILRNITEQQAKRDAGMKSKKEAAPIANATSITPATPKLAQPQRQQHQPLLLQQQQQPSLRGISEAEAAEASVIKITLSLCDTLPTNSPPAAPKRTSGNGDSGRCGNADKHDYHKHDTGAEYEDGEIPSEEQQESDPDADRDEPVHQKQRRGLLDLDDASAIDVPLDALPNDAVYPKKKKWGRPW